MKSYDYKKGVISSEKIEGVELYDYKKGVAPIGVNWLSTKAYRLT